MAATVEPLLYEEESTTLDFKRDQYPFQGATDAEKAELLKDILAFANAWRRTSAYILVGVDEIKGGRSKPHGVSNHIDDANLQQFVNQKTNKAIEFSYKAITLDGLPVGVIHIPLQDRPFFLKAPYGNLKQDTVYVRRGSSTAIALPDEIARMGAEWTHDLQRVSKLEANIVTVGADEVFGPTIHADIDILTIPDESEIPTYGAMNLGGYEMPGFDKNASYYREYAAYLKNRRGMTGFRFHVRNTGTAVAEDVRIIFEVEPANCYVCVGRRMPKRPDPDTNLAIPSLKSLSAPSPTLHCERTHKGWRGSALMGRLQAKAEQESTESLWVGAANSGTITVRAKVFADDLPSPVEAEYSIVLTCKQVALTVDEIIKLARAHVT